MEILILILWAPEPEMPDRSGPVALPLTKDNKTKEENQKLLNGNSGDPAEKV